MNQQVCLPPSQLGGISSMDLLLDDDMMEDTLLMEKASLLLQESMYYLDVTSTTNKKSTSSKKAVASPKDAIIKPSSSSSNSDKKVEIQPLQPQEKQDTNVNKPKKSFRFAPESLLEQVEYLAPRSPRIQERLYYSEEELNMMIHQLECDVADYCARGAKAAQLAQEAETNEFSSRGLERRTPQGSAQRAKWRKQCRTVVLDEQDRQWAVLPADEPVDDQRIAFVSLQVTHKAKLLARRRAIQDQKDVFPHDANATGDLVQATTDFGSDSSSSSRSSLSSRVQGAHQSTKHIYNSNSKGHSVHFPPSSRQLAQVFEYQHADTPEEKEAMWYPYLSLNQAKLRYASHIALLEHQHQGESNKKDQQNENDSRDVATNSSDEVPNLMTRSDVFNHDEESLRGLEARTTQAESAYELLRTQLAMAFRYQELDPALFAKQCQKLSAKSRKQARTRGLKDQRAVKAYLYQLEHPSQHRAALKTTSLPMKKKLVTRVPKKALVDASVKRSRPSSPTLSTTSAENAVVEGALAVDPMSAATDTNKNNNNLITRTMMIKTLPLEVGPTKQVRPPPRRVSDLSESSLSTGTTETMDSTLVSSSWSTLPSVGADDEDCSSLSSDYEPLERRNSLALFGLDRVAEEDDGDEEEEEEVLAVPSSIPSSMIISIPNKYFQVKKNDPLVNVQTTKTMGEAYCEPGVDDGTLWKNKADEDQPLTQELLEDDDVSLGEGSGRLSGIIERLWEKRSSLKS